MPTLHSKFTVDEKQESLLGTYEWTLQCRFHLYHLMQKIDKRPEYEEYSRGDQNATLFVLDNIQIWYGYFIQMVPLMI